ncbi:MULTISPECIES: hypothetical protein [Photobacterium]|uniref:hypothetical protein n=1 Tax=Photobacterium TaxID=657 RepID=UPI003D1385F9
MVTTRKVYLTHLYEQFDYYGTWLPNTPIKLGDIVAKKKGTYKVISTLSSYNLAFSVRESPEPLNFTYSSKAEFQLNVDADLAREQGIIPIGGRLSIEMNEQGGFVFQAKGCRVQTIDNIQELGRKLTKLVSENNWEEEWSVVDRIVVSDSSTIIIAKSFNGKVELSGKADFSLEELADVNAGLSVISQQGDVFQCVAARKLTPLFGLMSIKKSIWEKLKGIVKRKTKNPKYKPNVSYAVDGVPEYIVDYEDPINYSELSEEDVLERKTPDFN